MGFRFRKSISLGPVRVNLSKSGIGYSVGVKGARITKKANGGTRTTLSVPGTGISYVSDSKKGKKKTVGNNTNKTKMKEVSYTATSADGYNVSNIFNKFDLSDKEMLLLSFISQHYEQFNNEFSVHDMSALGHISTTTYYNNLYDKALLLKPSRGKYALNVALINQLAEEEIKKQKAIEEARLKKEKEQEQKIAEEAAINAEIKRRKQEQKQEQKNKCKKVLVGILQGWFTFVWILIAMVALTEEKNLLMFLGMIGVAYAHCPIIGPKGFMKRVLFGFLSFVLSAVIAAILT